MSFIGPKVGWGKMIQGLYKGKVHFPPHQFQERIRSQDRSRSPEGGGKGELEGGVRRRSQEAGCSWENLAAGRGKCGKGGVIPFLSDFLLLC